MYYKIMKQNLSNKLNNISMRITELSQILNISRPTLYKYMELYEIDEDKRITFEYKKLFDFITSNDCLSRQSLYLFLFKGGEEGGIKKEIIQLVHSTEDEEKLKKIKKILKGD